MTLIKIAGKSFEADQVQALIDSGLLNIGQKNDPASTTLPGAQLHGPLQSGANYGPLAIPGYRPGMFSAFQRPKSLAAVLPLERSDVWTEKISIMTGVTAEGGANATDWCGDPPGPGALKKCDQNYSFGRYYVKTELNAAAQVGMRYDRADVPREILNAGPAAHRMIPETMFRLPNTMSQLQYELFKFGVSAERDLCHVTIQGDTSLTSAQAHHGWIVEFAGLDSQIATGKSDATSELLCPAADSYVGSFNANVDGAATDGRTIVEFISDMVYGIRDRASSVGMGSTQWAFVGRKELFYALTAVWACNYWTARCAYSDNNAQQQDAFRVEELRREMLNGMYLIVDGIQYPWISDECVPQETLGNQYYKSDLYFVPLNWEGMPLARLQYFPMDNQYATEFTDAFGFGEVTRLNNGLWLVGKRDTGLCIEYHFQAMMRLILDAPFLAGRVDDIWYHYRAPSRNAIPGSSLYEDGGISYWTG